MKRTTPSSTAEGSRGEFEDRLRREAWTNGLLGRALFESGKDRARGRALVLDAYRQMKDDDRMDQEKGELTRWMKQRKIAL